MLAIFSLYYVCSLWAMVINVIWNRSCGPGGGTRRLHQVLWGRNRIDVLNKEIIFTRYDTAESLWFRVKKSKCKR